MSNRRGRLASTLIPPATRGRLASTLTPPATSALAIELRKYFESKCIKLQLGYRLKVHLYSLVGTFRAKPQYWERVLKPEVERILDEHGARLLPQVGHGMEAGTLQFFTEDNQCNQQEKK